MRKIGSSSRSSRVRQIVFQSALIISLAVGLISLGVLIVDVLITGAPRLNSQLFTSFPSSIPENAGAQSAIMGTIWVITLTGCICIPVGIGAAIYLEEYADPRRRLNRMIELNIQNLAAVPAIVYGILGLGVIVRGLNLGQTVIAAALTLSLLVLPIMIISAREAIRAVPPTVRQGALALGATQWQSIRRLVLPAAIPGIATGAILALSRAIGEAAPLVLLGGLTFITFNPDSVNSAFTVLPIQIYNWISRPQEEFRILAAAAIAVLIAILLFMNAIAIYLRNRYRREW
jgi:phosphate transport system permease protein